jgi:hypothetical protein
MVKSILTRFSLPVAKIQFLDENSTVIGTRETIVRTSLAVTAIVLIFVMGFILVRRL